MVTSADIGHAVTRRGAAKMLRSPAARVLSNRWSLGAFSAAFWRCDVVVPLARRRLTPRVIRARPRDVRRVFPHLDYPDFAGSTMANAESGAARIDGPAYAIDDQTAIKVVDRKVEVVFEGNWRYFGA